MEAVLVLSENFQSITGDCKRQQDNNVLRDHVKGPNGQVNKAVQMSMARDRQLSQDINKLTHESSGEVGVGADLAVNLDQALHHDLCDLGVGQGVLQAVAQEDHQGQRLTQLVWSLRRAGSEHSSQLVQHPCLRGIQTLQMLLGAASL